MGYIFIQIVNVVADWRICSSKNNEQFIPINIMGSYNDNFTEFYDFMNDDNVN